MAACADHGLHCFDLSSKLDVDGQNTIGRLTRQLHSKRFGHSDWVTSVAMLPDGRVLSGGQDSKLCLWNSSGVACKDLNGHSSAVSAIAVGDNDHAMSASYDTTVRCWNVSAKGADSGMECVCLRGHTAPVLDVTWGPGGVALSGDRAGVGILWDVATGEIIHELPGHGGHVTVVCGAMPPGDQTPVFLTGAQDGVLRVWDARANGCIATCPLHNHGQRGAVTKNDELCIKNEELCIRTEELCI